MTELCYRVNFGADIGGNKLMYAFSVMAEASHAHQDIAQGVPLPFIVYINFYDLYGAEKLCEWYLLKSGFQHIVIEKRKFLSKNLIEDNRVLAADPAIREAVEKGYFIQLFDQA